MYFEIFATKYSKIISNKYNEILEITILLNSQIILFFLEFMNSSIII